VVVLILLILGATLFGESAYAQNKNFTETKHEATYPGGEDAMLSFLGQTIKYPLIAHRTGIEGIVYIGFVVNKDGSLSEVEVFRDIGGGCGKAAAKAVKKMPNWSPATKNGLAVRSYFTLPVQFIAPEEPSKKEKSAK